ncbi:translocation/assembly module TamB domain-containing protein [Urechidicola croceus]|uniref:translocation/assembly module TamB domain-containing protein n=1 Tax=Urechidicola croceus TaxID=1850246 RepID=UPI0012EA5E03|nr:translocation/assembly module TamB domain-containing protein [Urechidicola croceus]
MQTRLGKIATNYLNEEFKTNIVIKKVDLSYLGSIKLKQIEILDHHKDSMINVNSLTTSVFNYRNILKNRLEFGDIDLEGVNFIIKTYKGEQDDAFSVFTDKFDDGNEDDTPSDFLMTSTIVNLKNANFKIYDENDDNVKPLKFQKISGVVYNFKIEGPNIYGDIKGLTFVENHGVKVMSLDSDFSYTRDEMKLLNTKLNTETSNVSTDIIFFRNGSFADFNNKVKFEADIQKADVSLLDLNKFYGEFGQNDVLHFKTKLTGTLNDFKINNLQLRSDLNSVILGDLHVKNGFNSEAGFSVNAKLSNLVSDYNHLKNLLPNILEKTLPTSFKELGRFAISGNMFITSSIIDAQIQMNTDLGTTISDLKLTNIDNIDYATYKGHIKIIDFELGKFAKDSLIGKLSLDADIDGRGFTLEDINTSIDGKIYKHQYKDYTYQNIDLNGQFENMKFNGKLIANDDNLKLSFNGLADLSTDIYKFDFDSKVDYANFNKLNLFKRDSIAILKGDINIKLIGNTIDDLAGDISFKNASYTNQNDIYLFKEFNVTSEFEKDVRTITINSYDIIDGEAKGKFKFNELGKLTGNSVGSIYTNYKPFKVTSGQYIDFNFKIYNKIVEVFYPKIALGTNTSIRGSINSDDNEFKLSLRSPQIDVYDNVVDDIRLQIDNKNPLFNTQLSIDKIENKYYNISDLNLVNVTLNDTLFFRTEFIGGIEKSEKYDLGFYHTIDPNRKSVIGINKSDIIFKNTTWQINPNDNDKNKVVFDNKLNTFDIQDFDMVSGLQKIKFSGDLIGNSYKDLNFNFENVDLAGITPKIDKWNFAGLINGQLEYKQDGDEILPIANVSVEDFFVNETYQGNLQIDMKGQNSVKKFDVDILIENRNTKNLVANGWIDLEPKNPLIDMNIDFEKFKLDLLKPLGDENFTNIRGDVYGNTKLTGLLENPTMNGELFLDSSGVAFPYLNVDYDFEGTTVLELHDQTFEIIDLTLHDTEYKTRGSLLGTISHKKFSDWKLDLSLDTKNLLVLNTPESEDALYYGQGFIDGNATISGFTDNLTIDVNGRTNDGTYFVIPLSDVKTIDNSRLVTFVTERNEDEEFILPDEILLDKFKGLSLNFNLEVTKDAIVEMVIDKSTGSTLKGSGTGDLRIEIDTKGKFNMFGGFEIDNGTYDFKYGGFINKQFIATRGGTVSWNGSPYTAELDIETIHRVNANPKSILENISTTRNIPVDLVVHFSGELYDSRKEYTILIPDAGSNLKSELDFKINQSNDENARIRHFGSLLVSGSFFNDNLGDLGSSLVSGTTSQLLSSALSSMINTGNSNFTLGVDYQAGERNSNIDNLNTDDQLGLTLATQLNDRILIDGKVGVPVGSKQKSAVVGEVKVEFLLNEEGTLRSNVFNRQNEIQYDQEEEGYTQGVGLSYQFDFDNTGELLEKLGLKKKVTKTDSTEVKKDSIKPKQLINFGAPKN